MLKSVAGWRTLDSEAEMWRLSYGKTKYGTWGMIHAVPAKSCRRGSAAASSRRDGCADPRYNGSTLSPQVPGDPMSETERKRRPSPERRPFELPQGYDGLAEARRLLRTIRSGGLGTWTPTAGIRSRPS